MMSDYHDRCIKQGMKWVNGISEHNHIDNECTPDFSCCYPDMFDKDQQSRQRRHDKLVQKLRSKTK